MKQETAPLHKAYCPSLTLVNRGKVRDSYALRQHLLLVSTDRISAFDVVSDQGIPGKGHVLTAMSAFWFEWLAKNLPWLKTHYITADWDEICHHHPEVAQYGDQLAGRSMLVNRMARIFQTEAIVRGYLYGSSVKDYNKTGAVCGIALPPGLQLADRFAVPLFTPSTKAAVGQHDQNISIAQALEMQLVTANEMQAIVAISLTVFMAASEYAKAKGIILVDTKFEFGIDENGDLTLADEVLTPDSSRFWPADSYVPGQDQPSFDKQFVREYLEGLVKAGQWDKTAPMPELPAGVIAGTTERYELALAKLTT